MSNSAAVSRKRPVRRTEARARILETARYHLADEEGRQKMLRRGFVPPSAEELPDEFSRRVLEYVRASLREDD